MELVQTKCCRTSVKKANTNKLQKKTFELPSLVSSQLLSLIMVYLLIYLLTHSMVLDII
jgi:hypothetical protein